MDFLVLSPLLHIRNAYEKTETEEDNSDGLTPTTDAGLKTRQRNYVPIFQAMAYSLACNTTQQRQQDPSTRLHYDKR